MPGEKGIMGYVGEPGLQGITGPPGAPGISIKGPQGLKGYSGEPGSQGPRGFPGTPGLDGLKGFPVSFLLLLFFFFGRNSIYIVIRYAHRQIEYSISKYSVLTQPFGIHLSICFGFVL